MSVAHIFAAQVDAKSPAGADSDSGMRRSHMGCCSALSQQAVAQIYYWRLRWISQYSHTSGITRYVLTTTFQVLGDECNLALPSQPAGLYQSG